MIPKIEPDRLELFIASLSRRIAGSHRDTYLGADDLAQEGQIALLRARRNWVPALGRFEGYARTVIRREMNSAVIAAKGALSGPLKIKRQGLQAKCMRQAGEHVGKIAESLGLPRSAVIPLIQLVTPASSEGIE